MRGYFIQITSPWVAASGYVDTCPTGHVRLVVLVVSPNCFDRLFRYRLGLATPFSLNGIWSSDPISVMPEMMWIVRVVFPLCSI